MSRQAFFWFFLMSGILLLSGESNAECNGVTPVEGENWVIDELTHCWDESFEINDMEVNDGGLRLENVTLTSHGKITIKHPTIWEKSTITHNSSSNEDNIQLESQLTIKGTNLSMYAPEGLYSGSDVEGIRLNLGSKLIITDIDNNPLTTHDVSTISSMNWNVSDPNNPETRSIITNSERDKLITLYTSLVLDNNDQDINGIKKFLDLFKANDGIELSGNIYPDNQVDEKWHNIGIRIEDDVVVSSVGHEVLSDAVPKTRIELEKTINSNAKYTCVIGRG